MFTAPQRFLSWIALSFAVLYGPAQAEVKASVIAGVEVTLVKGSKEPIDSVKASAGEAYVKSTGISLPPWCRFLAPCLDGQGCNANPAHLGLGRCK